MDTDALPDRCLAVPSRHSFPGVPGRPQPLHHTIVLGCAYRIRLTWLLLGISLIQTEVFAMIRTAVPTLAALHPVLALVVFALALIIALQARTVVRASVATHPTHGKNITSGTIDEKRELGI